MTDDLVLHYPRSLDSRVNRVINDIAEVKTRLTSIETRITSLDASVVQRQDERCLLVRTRSRPFLVPALNILWLAQSMEKGHAEGDVRSISHEPHWRPGKRRICDGRHVGMDVPDSYYRAKGYQPDFDKLPSKDEYEAAEGAKAKKSTRAQ